LLNCLRRAVLVNITDPRMRDVVEDSGSNEVRGAGGDRFLPAHAGQECCPRVAALMYTGCQHEHEGEDWMSKAGYKSKDCECHCFIAGEFQHWGKITDS